MAQILHKSDGLWAAPPILKKSSPCSSCLRGALLFFALVSAAAPARAEIFLLNGGGRIVGEWANADELPRNRYVIRTDAGRITLERSEVQQVLRPNPAELEYEKVAPSYADTPDDQMKLANWCADQHLYTIRKSHLERIIELDPDNAEARRLLGYARDKATGKWMTPSEKAASQGLVRYNGRWVTPQEVEILDKQKKTNVTQKDWIQRINRWRGWLGTDRDQQAREAIDAIKDPDAVPGLVKALENDDRFQPRRLYIEALARLDTKEAVLQLAYTALVDGNEEIRLTCLDHLKSKPHPEVVAYFTRMLRDKKNVMVNRAAVGLQSMNDRTAIRPLIESLVTTHQFVVTQGGSPGSISTSFGTGPNSGGGGMSMGGGPKIVKRDFQNPSVLTALIALTNGVNFNYDVPAWRTWYASIKTRDTIDARRDSGK